MKDELQPLKDELEDRINLAKEAIADAGLAGDWSHAQAVAGAVKDLESSLKRLADVRTELQRAIITFDNLTKSNTRAPITRLLIHVDWRVAGKDRPSALVDEPTGAEAMARFIETLVEVLGQEILTSIQRIPTGGSGLVSKNPRTDFINPANGEIYGHKPIGNTGWHVKTNTSTKNKAEQIQQINTILGLPRHAVEVEIVER